MRNRGEKEGSDHVTKAQNSMVRVWTLFYYCSIVSNEGASVVLKQKNGKNRLYPKTTLRFTWMVD